MFGALIKNKGRTVFLSIVSLTQKLRVGKAIVVILLVLLSNESEAVSRFPFSKKQVGSLTKQVLKVFPVQIRKNNTLTTVYAQMDMYNYYSTGSGISEYAKADFSITLYSDPELTEPVIVESPLTVNYWVSTQYSNNSIPDLVEGFATIQPYSSWVFIGNFDLKVGYGSYYKVVDVFSGNDNYEADIVN